MKHAFLAFVGISVLAGVLGASGPVAASRQQAAALRLLSVQHIREHLDLRAAAQGRISQTDSYVTADSMQTVLTRYVGAFQPEPGQHKPGQCVVLRRSRSNSIVRHAELVTVCQSGNGTRIINYSRLFVAR